VVLFSWVMVMVMSDGCQRDELVRSSNDACELRVASIDAYARTCMCYTSLKVR